MPNSSNRPPHDQRTVGNSSSHNATPRRSGRGFAGMDAEKQKEIASKGGKAAHASGNAHQWSAKEAREAGRKGGQASGKRRAA